MGSSSGGAAGPLAAGRAADIVVLDSITKIAVEHRGRVVVAASHGGLYVGACAAEGGARAAIFNDAGVGRDHAGISSLTALDGIGMAAATASHQSCRIGDGRDMMDHGSISHVNRAAAALGCVVGEPVAVCAGRMRAASPASGDLSDVPEARFVIREAAGEPRVVGIDSASLLWPEDDGAIVVTASHGGLLGVRKESGVDVPVLAITFSDAGLGKEEAGASRLPVLAARNILAVTASADSARIGDARSIYADGVISRVNQPAAALGVRPGDRIAAFVDAVLARSRTS